MKRSPDMQRLDEVLRSSKLVSGGFLGDDGRPVEEIIEADRAAVVQAGHSLGEIADRMKAITEEAKRGLETDVRIGESLEARTTSARGMIPCPWPHPGRHGKTVTIVTRTDTGQTVQWSDLNIHLIEAHGFFEGRGSPFRNEPKTLIEVLF